jgi:hypothetical protein
MDESTMFAVGDTWLDLAAKGVSLFGVTRAKQKDKRPPSKRPSGSDETPESAAPSKVTVDARIRLVLDACDVNGIEKPPRGAYLRVAQNCTDDRLRDLLIECINKDRSFTEKTFFDQAKGETIATYLIERINTMRTASTTTHFGRRRVSHATRPPYAMSPWTAV